MVTIGTAARDVEEQHRRPSSRGQDGWMAGKGKGGIPGPAGARSRITYGLW